MVAAALLRVAVLWRLAFLDEQYLADPVAGAAAALVAIPVPAASWNSVVRPSLPGMTDLLVAIASLPRPATEKLCVLAVWGDLFPVWSQHRPFGLRRGP